MVQVEDKPLPPRPEPPVAIHNFQIITDQLDSAYIESLPLSIKIEHIDIDVSPILPTLYKPKIVFEQSVLPLPQPCLGNKIKIGDIIDSEHMPFASKPWNPDPKNKLLRWFDSKWKSDGEYELVNYCIFPVHIELELHRS